MPDLLTKWLPRELRREFDAISAGSFRPIGRGKSARTKLVQEWLCIAGHGITVDGDFGPATEEAGTEFRAQHEMGDADAVDAATLQVLVAPMEAALTPISDPHLDLGDLVLAYARQHLARHPIEIGCPNCGPWVRLYMDGNERARWAWCAGFVTFVLRQACETLGSSMPVAGSFSCDGLPGDRRGEEAELGCRPVLSDRALCSPWTAQYIRSDNGSEFTAGAVRTCFGRIGVKTLFIEPGSLWENGYNESFNGKLRDELLNGEIFYTLKEAQVLIERWRRHYNTIRPHSALGYRPPAPEAIQHHRADLFSALDGLQTDQRCRNAASSLN